ncbi:MAG TPA: GDSL-type esterase/lipase family protein [Acidimicrobiales bacterium]
MTALLILLLVVAVTVALSNTGTTPVSASQTVPPTTVPLDTGPSSVLDDTTTTSPLESTTTSSATTVPGGSETTNPVTTGAPGASTAVTSPEIPNPAGNVAIIGDSITKLAETDLAHALHDYKLYIDAVSKTTMAEHLQKIEALASDGQPRDWVIELGTNDALPEPSNPNWASDFANEVAALQGQRCVVFLTVNPRLGPIGTGINAAIASAVATHPNFHSIDWGDIEFRKPQWLVSDGIHPTKAGQVELTKLDHQAIRSCQDQ